MNRFSPSTQSTARGRRWIARGLTLAALAGVTMVGNLRLQASEMEQRARHAGMENGAPRYAARDMRIVSNVDTKSHDDVQLVPAIYAWDPDVRFVFFRHVSKWM